MAQSKVKRTGTHRLNGPISVLNPMPDGPEKKILRPGHYVFDFKEGRFVPYHEYFSRPENNAPAVHTDQAKWLNTMDWGAGKNWADHGGRKGREEWMKRDQINCHG